MPHLWTGSDTIRAGVALLYRVGLPGQDLLVRVEVPRDEGDGEAQVCRQQSQPWRTGRTGSQEQMGCKSGSNSLLL